MTPQAQARALVKDWYDKTEQCTSEGLTIGFSADEWSQLEIMFASALETANVPVWTEEKPTVESENDGLWLFRANEYSKPEIVELPSARHKWLIACVYSGQWARVVLPREVEQ